MNFASRLSSAIAGFSIIVGVGGLAVVVAFAAAMCIFAAITAIQGLIAWALWMLVAPMLPFVPAEYVHLTFFQVWGIVAVIRIIGRVLFATVKKSN